MKQYVFFNYHKKLTTEFETHFVEAKRYNIEDGSPLEIDHTPSSIKFHFGYVNSDVSFVGREYLIPNLDYKIDNINELCHNMNLYVFGESVIPC